MGVDSDPSSGVLIVEMTTDSIDLQEHPEQQEGEHEVPGLRRSRGL